MAAGKNAACDILQDLCFVCADCDKMGHSVLALEQTKQKIIDAFSTIAKQKGLFLEDGKGNIDKKALAKIVFSDPALLKQHEAIVHPLINQMCLDFIKKNSNSNIALNATVLYKVPVIKQCQKVIFIDAPKIIRFFRVIRRDHIPIKQILQRFSFQNELFSKYQDKNADIIRVLNITSLAALKAKLQKALFLS